MAEVVTSCTFAGTHACSKPESVPDLLHSMQIFKQIIREILYFNYVN